jgi:hypothetical protein
MVLKLIIPPPVIAVLPLMVESTMVMLLYTSVAIPPPLPLVAVLPLMVESTTVIAAKALL